MPQALQSPAARAHPARPLDPPTSTSATTLRSDVATYATPASNDARIAGSAEDLRTGRLERGADRVHRGRLESYALMHEARAARARALGDLAAAGARIIVATVAHMWRRYRRRRHTRAIFDVLYDLDDRTLRDLGFHRAEIRSVAAEATGEVEWTRVRTPLRPRAPR